MNSKDKPQERIIRVSQPCFTETLRFNRVGTEYDSKSTFCQEVGVIRSDSQRNYEQRFTIEADGSAGLRVEIYKYGNKRSTELSTQIGLDEIEMLIRFLTEVKDQCRNYHGESKTLAVS